MKNRIWIWGIASAGKFLYRYLTDQGSAVCGIIDNSPAYKGFKYGNAPIYMYMEGKRLLSPDDLIIVCTRKDTYRKIEEELNSDGYKNVIWSYDYVNYEGYTNRFIENSYEESLDSKICDSEDFNNPKFVQICETLKDIPRVNGNHIIFHRKLWEWCYIVLVLKELGMLKNGKKGIGFAVGKEPLPALFASCGVDILATDLAGNTDIAKGWSLNNENAGSNINNLYYSSLCSRQDFLKHVSYLDVNMNSLPGELCKEQFDFVWSSCAIEHVGSLVQSKEFLVNMVSCLKSGGVAIHTTEFNLSSEDETIEYGWNIIWRKKDINEIKIKLASIGCDMNISYCRTNSNANNYIDLPPFEGEKEPYHMNLSIDGYVSTSIALVIKKR